MVDALDTTSLASALNRVTHEEELRNELRAKGLNRAREFTWAKTASLTWAVYEELS